MIWVALVVVFIAVVCQVASEYPTLTEREKEAARAKREASRVEERRGLLNLRAWAIYYILGFGGPLVFAFLMGWLP